MTNAERNLAIAKLVGLDVYKDKRNGKWYCMKGGTINNPIPKYSTNWNDLMPLVVEHGISLYKYRVKGYWEADSNIGGVRSEVLVGDTNPQIALAECLLKVLETKDE